MADNRTHNVSVDDYIDATFGESGYLQAQLYVLTDMITLC